MCGSVWLQKFTAKHIWTRTKANVNFNFVFLSQIFIKLPVHWALVNMGPKVIFELLFGIFANLYRLFEVKKRFSTPFKEEELWEIYEDISDMVKVMQ